MWEFSELNFDFIKTTLLAQKDNLMVVVGLFWEPSGKGMDVILRSALVKGHIKVAEKSIWRASPLKKCRIFLLDYKNEAEQREIIKDLFAQLQGDPKWHTWRAMSALRMAHFIKGEEHRKRWDKIYGQIVKMPGMGAKLMASPDKWAREKTIKALAQNQKAKSLRPVKSGCGLKR